MKNTQHAMRKMPVMDERMRRRVFSEIHRTRDRILEAHQGESLLVSLSKGIASGSKDAVLSMLSLHPVSRAEIFTGGKAQAGRFEDAGHAGLFP